MASSAAKRVSDAAARVPPWLVYLAGAVPGVAVFTLGVLDQLGADPLKVVEHELGEWALIFIVAGLTVTPLRQVAGVNLLRFRRALGLLAFFYALAHLAVYVVLDQGLDWRAIWADILKRPYITVGMASFLLLLPLAITSNHSSIRRLGGAAWQKLHKLVYAAALLAALHYVLVVKAWPLEPLVYLGLVLALLGYRALKKLTKRPKAREVRA